MVPQFILGNLLCYAFPLSQPSIDQIMYPALARRCVQCRDPAGSSFHTLHWFKTVRDILSQLPVLGMYTFFFILLIRHFYVLCLITLFLLDTFTVLSLSHTVWTTVHKL